jgi:hypothetical protein
MQSDSNYSAATRHRRPLNPKAARPPVLELVDAQWAADKLSDDEVEVGRHEADAGGFEEGELDADAIVVSPAGNSSSVANSGECVCALVKQRSCQAVPLIVIYLCLKLIQQLLNDVDVKKAGTTWVWTS